MLHLADAWLVPLIYLASARVVPNEQYLFFLCLVFPCPPSGRDVWYPLVDVPLAVYILGPSELTCQTIDG